MEVAEEAYDCQLQWELEDCSSCHMRHRDIRAGRGDREY
jgi:hypothetical protein